MSSTALSLALALALAPVARADWGVLTYNIQFRPEMTELDPNTPGTNEDTYGMTDKERAEAIAAHILALENRPQILVFNEDFEREAHEVLSDALHDPYERQTRFHPGVAELGDWTGSGLALFTTDDMRFQPLGKVPDDQCLYVTDQRDCLVLFKEFRRVNDVQGTGEPAAQKGVAYAHLLNGKTGRRIHLFFTHLHSTESKVAREARAEQLQIITDWIEELVPANDTGADLLLVGDLNIQGARDADGHVTFPMTSDALAEEWRDVLRDGPIATTGLEDTRLRQSELDPQATTDGTLNTADPSGSFSRIDYVMSRSVGCPMHAVVHHGFESEAGRDLSDHFPLSVRFGGEQERCSPDLAEPLDPAATEPVPGEVPLPGNVQWFRADAGTWTFEVEGDSPTVQLVVYAASNLSDPLEAVGTQASSQNGRFTVPLFDTLGPIFVRVDDTNPVIGSFELHARANTGASFADPLFLQPGEEVQLIGLPLQHYALSLVPLDSGEAQQLRLLAECTSGKPLFTLADDEAPHATLLEERADALCGGVDCFLPDPVEDPFARTEAETVLLRVACEDPGALLDFVQYHTNRRTMTLGELTSVVETDWLNLSQDDVKVTATVDGGEEDVIFDDLLDVGEGAPTLPRVYHFADQVEFVLVERDYLTQDETFKRTFAASSIPDVPGSTQRGITLEGEGEEYLHDGEYDLRFEARY